MTKSIIADRTFEFSLKIIELYTKLKGEKEFVLSDQVLRSATSIGANVEEAVSGLSKKEFTYRMGIGLKEARETKYWLRLLDKSQVVKGDYSYYLKEIEEIKNILGAIVNTSKTK